MINYTKTDTLLSVNNINLTINNDVILSNINFQIKDIVIPGIDQSQVVSLVARSGIGKSSLLRLLAGLKIKNSTVTGNILINKEQIQVKEGNMGMVFQDYYLPKYYRLKKLFIKSAKKNPEFKKDNDLINKAIIQLTEDFELTEHINKFPSQLSGGQRQRTNIVIQLLNGSNFILMDEPFSGLDPIMIDKTIKLLKKVALQSELRTIIIVSHDLETCCSISDTIFVLSDKGREKNTGSTIIKEIDLISRGIAWQENPKRMEIFHQTIEEIKSLLI